MKFTYNRTNFHTHTFCIFQEVDLNAIHDLKLNYKSKSSSSYYFVENGVYRLSNHWGRAANCKWRLVCSNSKNNVNSIEKAKRTLLGFAKWTDFYPDNDHEKLYFLKVDYETQTVHYFHKQNENYTSETLLRTSSETTKISKQIRKLFEETAWTKHLKSGDSDVLIQEIIMKLINTNQTFQEIRKEYLL